MTSGPLLKWLGSILLGMIVLAGCIPAQPPTGIGGLTEPPPAIPREFRGVWVATVSNIDWPSQPGLPVEQQKAELLAILDRAAELNLNAVVLQVRPAADALYPSELEPWSEYLTGQMGQAPEPFYDPLAFAVQEAHRRGLELHAWFNPYRVRHPSAESEISADHLSRTHPDLVREYGTHLWMDPGEQGVQDHSIRVILDVVRRYAIDGVHLDDYFYPYQQQDSLGNLIEFPDEPSWNRYVQSGGTLSRDDWRRHNVDIFVQRLYEAIKDEKPWVKFGISPFGIWRPGYPEQIEGYDAYARLYADARKWIRSGWVDYFTPQLYWPIAQTPQSYPVLLRWWVEQNAEGRNLWPGNFTGRVAFGNAPFWDPSEVIGQINVTRGQPGATGNVHFSMRVFMQNPDSLVEKLTTEVYAIPALVPPSPWLWSDPPGRPAVSLQDNPAEGVTLTLEPRGRTQPTWWVIRARYGDEWTMEIVPAWQRSYTLAESGVPPDVVVVSGVDRTGNEGATTIVRRNGR